MLSVLLACALCLLFAVCANASATDDDWTISFYLSGRLPDEGLCLYVNAALSAAIYWLDCTLPALNWFFVLEYLTTFFAAAALFYGALSYSRLRAALVLIGFVSYFVLPNCILASNYTYVSFLATTAGGFLLVSHLSAERVGRLERWMPVPLVAMGLCWRFEMFLLCFAAIVIVYAWQCLTAADVTRGSGSGRLRVLVVPLVVAAVCGGLYVCNRIAWSQDGWRQWQEYDSVRQKTSDYPLPDYADAKDRLDAIGVSENDYYLMTSWANGDVDVLNADVLRQVASLGSTSSASLGKVMASVPTYLLSLAKEKKLLLSIVLLVLVLSPRAREERLLVFGGVLFAVVACSYFLSIGRLLPRVELPAWGVSLGLCAAAVGKGVRADDERKTAASAWARGALNLASACFLIVAVVACARMSLPTLDLPAFAATFDQTSYVSSGPFSTYLTSHPENTYVVESGVESWLDLEYGHRFIPSSEVASRTIWLGGWGSGSPFRRAQCKAVGATNPFEALLTGERVYLMATPSTADHVLLFLREHYDANATMTEVDEFACDGGTVNVWAITR